MREEKENFEAVDKIDGDREMRISYQGVYLLFIYFFFLFLSSKPEEIAAFTTWHRHGGRLI